jgi:hypothetical protein
MSVADLIAQVVPEKKDRGVDLTPSEVDAIVEIAYLTIAADRRLEADEITAFRGVVERLRGEAISEGALDRVLDEMYKRAERARGKEEGGRGYADERLHALAAKMSTGARELAYRTAYAMGLSDMESSDEEFELDLQLVDALELTNDRAEELADEVMAILNPSE